MKSNCCNAEIKSHHDNEGAGYYSCVRCRRACDVLEDEPTISIPDSGNIRSFEGGAIRDDDRPQRTFPGGAVRDSNKGKPRYDLIPPEALLRLAKHYAYGAERYAPDNWKHGMTREVFIESAFRHFEAVRMNKKDEDHAAACIWNLSAIIWLEENENNKRTNGQA